MCGIVGYIGKKEAQTILFDGLSRLEYRGYDSAGIATLERTATEVRTHICRKEGKLIGLKKALQENPCAGQIGIGHTRWATHGVPSERNAHPHFSDGITIVHNGIIENHHEFKQQLTKEGRVFLSDTDSEIIAHLIAKEKALGKNLVDAFCSVLSQVKGAYALAVLDESEPNTFVCARQATPLVIGVGEGENFIAADFPALLPYTRDFYILEDGDVAVISAERVQIVNTSGVVQNRALKQLDWSPMMAEKGGYKHFMRKEIAEQPRVLTDTLRGRLQFEQKRPYLEGIDSAQLNSVNRIVVVACGTSYLAGQVGRAYFEEMVRIPTSVELASEFRYSDPVLDEKTLVIGISQSGETADTLGALGVAQSLGSKTLGICNVVDSALARLCAKGAGTLYTRAGPEISVASTKAFVTQVAALQMLALQFAHERKTLAEHVICGHMENLTRLPRLLESVLETEDHIRNVATQYMHCQDMLYLGRGALYPIALEGALKMKELSYVHAEGYAAGELKHGPIALIDSKMPVVVLALPGKTYDKTMSSAEQVKARGGRVIAVCEAGDKRMAAIAESTIELPPCSAQSLPILAVLPLQLLAYHLADLRGTDVDQPRNLAKSVTVE